MTTRVQSTRDTGATEGSTGNVYPYPVEGQREIDDEELSFLSEYTRETDLAALRRHLLDVWRQVKEKTWVYGCIQNFLFLEPHIRKHPTYKLVLDAASEAKKNDQRLVHLDVGCCFGQDTRRLVLDGFPAEDTVVSDIAPAYWRFGLQIFKDDGRLASRALFGSMTDPAFVSEADPLAPTAGLVGRVDFAWAQAVLHVFDEANAREFCGNVRLLLKPGGVMYGGCVGQAVAGVWATPTPGDRGKSRYIHSKESLPSMLHEVGFSQVEVTEMGMDALGEKARAMDRQIQGSESPRTYLIFSATK